MQTKTKVWIGVVIVFILVGFAVLGSNSKFFTGKLIKSPLPLPTRATCTDSDGGINKTVRGEAAISTRASETDSCVSSNELLEHFCDKADRMQRRVVTCDSGTACVDGACVASETPPPPWRDPGECGDGVDNDGDEAIDGDDWVCQRYYDKELDTFPTVAKAADASSELTNGANVQIAKITISADPHKEIALKRIVINFDSTALDVSDLEIFRKIGSGSVINITSQLSIRNSAGLNLKAGGSPLRTTDRSIDPEIILTWDNSTTDQEFVSRGTTNTYIVKATIANAIIGSMISTYLADVTSGPIWGDANTLLTAPENYNFIWSDNSATAHTTSTLDWTNGAVGVVGLPTEAQALTY